jgi:hypothetical protein
MCLACLKWGSTSEFSDEAGGALGTGSRQRGKDLPGGNTVPGFIATGDFASDDRLAQLALGQVVGGINSIVI